MPLYEALEAASAAWRNFVAVCAGEARKALTIVLLCARLALGILAELD
jgi:hypothetical protein